MSFFIEHMSISILIIGAMIMVFLYFSYSPESVIDQPVVHSAKYVVVVPIKSTGVAWMLTILLGPIGIFYSSVTGGLVMTPICMLLGFLFGPTSFLLTWPICIAWGVMSVNVKNNDLINHSLS